MVQLPGGNPFAKQIESPKSDAGDDVGEKGGVVRRKIEEFDSRDDAGRLRVAIEALAKAEESVIQLEMRSYAAAEILKINKQLRGAWKSLHLAQVVLDRERSIEDRVKESLSLQEFIESWGQHDMEKLMSGVKSGEIKGAAFVDKHGVMHGDLEGLYNSGMPPELVKILKTKLADIAKAMEEMNGKESPENGEQDG